MRRGKQRIFTARHVAAGSADGDIFVAEDDARQRFDLDVFDELALMFRETANLFLREGDIIQVAFG